MTRVEDRSVQGDPERRASAHLAGRDVASARYGVTWKTLIAIEDQWRRVLGSRLMDELETALEKLDDWRP
jgi:hypothetical protein